MRIFTKTSMPYSCFLYAITGKHSTLSEFPIENIPIAYEMEKKKLTALKWHVFEERGKGYFISS